MPISQHRNYIAQHRSDAAAALLLTFGIPLFFPLIWQGKAPGPFHGGMIDTIPFFEPYALEFIRAIRSGQNPFWSHTSSFGAPTLLTLGTGALHPFHIFHLMMPDWLAFAVGWWARISLFSLYFYAYLRLAAVRPWLALSATLSLSFGSMFINYSQEIIGYVLAFVPMAFFHLERLRHQISSFDVALLALAVAMMVLGGFLSVIVYLLLLLGLYALSTRLPLRALIVSALAVVAGTSLTLPAIVETLRFFPKTGYDPAQREALFFYTPSLATAFNLVSPSIFGDSVSYAQAGQRDFYGRLLGAGIIGVPLSLLLAVHAFWTRSRLDARAMFWIGAFLVTLAIYFNAMGVKTLIHHVPVLNEHPLTRLQVIIAISAAAMWAIVMERALGEPALAPRRWAALLAILAGVLIVTFVAIALTQPGAHVGCNSFIHLCLGLASTAALAAAVRWPQTAAPLLFVASIAITGLVTSFHYIFYYKPDQYYPRTPLIRHIEHKLRPGSRILDVNDILFQGRSVAYGVPSITKHWFAQPKLRDWVARLSDVGLVRGLSNDQVRSIDGRTAWPELRRMHVQFIAIECPQADTLLAADRPAGEYARAVATDGEICLLEVLYEGQSLDALGALSGEGYTDYEDGEGRISLVATSGTVKIPVRFDPGWRVASGNGRISESSEHLIVISTYSAVDLPQRIELTYWPRHVALLSGIGVVPLFLLIVAVRRLQRRSGGE